jgi:MoaA/NifB/PqqE/SkfB family radical SAM enzyme
MQSAQRTIPNPLECLYLVCSTICNLSCRFCAYHKSSIPRQSMPFSLFSSAVDQATVFGFETFNLTPLVGESLTDPDFAHKLQHLDQHPEVHDFYFCTNLTLADDAFLAFAAGLKKMRWLSISLYGHDAESFSHLTGGTKSTYRKLLDNLQLLAQHPALLPRTELRLRSAATFDYEACHSELCSIVRQLVAQGVRLRIPTDYQNWGGLIEASDIEDLPIELKTSPGSRQEPCVFPYFKPTVLPDGRLNACSSGDGNAALIIGDLKSQGFEEIYSPSNRAYLRLLEAHQAGRFDPPCRDCSSYRPLSADWYSYAYHRKPFVSLHEFQTWLSRDKARDPAGRACP